MRTMYTIFDRAKHDMRYRGNEWMRGVTKGSNCYSSSMCPAFQGLAIPLLDLCFCGSFCGIKYYGVSEWWRDADENEAHLHLIRGTR